MNHLGARICEHACVCVCVSECMHATSTCAPLESLSLSLSCSLLLSPALLSLTVPLSLSISISVSVSLFVSHSLSSPSPPLHSHDANALASSHERDSTTLQTLIRRWATGRVTKISCCARIMLSLRTGMPSFLLRALIIFLGMLQRFAQGPLLSVLCLELHSSRLQTSRRQYNVLVGKISKISMMK